MKISKSKSDSGFSEEFLKENPAIADYIENVGIVVAEDGEELPPATGGVFPADYQPDFLQIISDRMERNIETVGRLKEQNAEYSHVLFDAANKDAKTRAGNSKGGSNKPLAPWVEPYLRLHGAIERKAPTWRDPHIEREIRRRIAKELVVLPGLPVTGGLKKRALDMRARWLKRANSQK